MRNIFTGGIILAVAFSALGWSRQWTFDGTLLDVDGQSPFQLDEGAAQYVDAGNGHRALKVDKARVKLTDNPRYDLRPGFRVAFRVRFDEPYSATHPCGSALLSKGNTGDQGAFLLRVNGSVEGTDFSCFANVDGEIEPRVRCPGKVAMGRWYDVAAQWDGTNLALTVDGVTRRQTRRGPGGGSQEPLAIGPFVGAIADLRISGADQPPPSADVSLVPGFRLSATACFDEVPKKNVSLVRKDREYWLRYDPDPATGIGAFRFWVFLDGGWEPNVSLRETIVPGRRYELSAAWSGQELQLALNGRCRKIRRSGGYAPSKAPLALGARGVKVSEVLFAANPHPLPCFGEMRTKELMPQDGQPFTVLGELQNHGAPVMGGKVRFLPPEGVRMEPSEIAFGEIGYNDRLPFACRVAPGTNGIVNFRAEAYSAKGRLLCRLVKPFATMPTNYPAFCRGDWMPPVRATRTFHVDAQAGDDGKDGLTPATAWRSLKALRGRVLGPGERVLLKRGSVFNEELVITAKASPDNWAEIGAYGEGARPTIRRTRDLDDRCAYIVDPECLVVRDLIVCHAGKGLDIVCTSGGSQGGILVERILAHHIEGLYRPNSTGIPEWFGKKGAPGASGSNGGGVNVGGNARNVVIRDCESYQCSNGYRANGNNVCVRRMFCHDNFCHNTSPHPFVTGTRRAWLLDSVMQASGWHAARGTMGIMLGFNTGMVIANCHFLDQPHSGCADEGGIDFECGGENYLLDGLTFRNNAGAAIEVLGLISPQAKNIHIRNCKFDHDNRMRKNGPAEIAVWGGTKDRHVVCSSGLIEGNGYSLVPGIPFYTNAAESTRADWHLADNREFPTTADLDRAMPRNEPPCVKAGGEIWTDALQVALSGCVTDDGLPQRRRLAVNWEQLEGAGRVHFADATSAATTARFPGVGDYRLNLMGDDGELWRTARTAVHILPKGEKVLKAWAFATNRDAEGWAPVELGTTKEIFTYDIPQRDSFAEPVKLVCGDYYVLAMRQAAKGAIALGAEALGALTERPTHLVVKMQNHTPAKTMRLMVDDAAIPFAVTPNDLEDRLYRIPLPARAFSRLKLCFSDGVVPVTGTCRIDYIYLGRK